MRSIAACLIILIASNAHAMSIDTLPLPSSFDLCVTAHGMMHEWEDVPIGFGYTDTLIDNGSSPQPLSFSIHVTNVISQDTLPGAVHNAYYFSNDTLIYSTSQLNFDTYIFDTVIIVFDTLTKEIHTLNYNWYSKWYNCVYSSPNYSCIWKGFSFKNMNYDRDSIYCRDSSLENYLVDCGYQSDLRQYHLGEQYSAFHSISSVDLSCIFHPTHLSSLAAVNSIKDAALISFTSRERTLYCSLPYEDRVQRLTLYTLLGVQAASVVVNPGEIHVQISNLPSGLYFLRLGERIERVYIPEH